MAGAEVLTCGDDGNRMRCACVDIGTNTTRLLVAERDDGRLREVVAVRRFLRLVPDDGRCDPARGGGRAGGDRGRARARGPPARRARRCASSAPRRSAAASNRDELCAAVHVGVRHPRRGPHRRAGGRSSPSPGRWPPWRAPPAGAIGVIDVGGGSSRARDRDRRATASRGGDRCRSARGPWPRATCAPTRRRWPSSPTPAPRSTSRSRASTRPRPTSSSPSAAARRRWRRPAAASSTPASIARILAVLLEEPAAEAAKRLGLHVERVRLLPAGLLALEAAWGAFGQAPLQIARGGLREGVIMRDIRRS